MLHVQCRSVVVLLICFWSGTDWGLRKHLFFFLRQCWSHLWEREKKKTWQNKYGSEVTDITSGLMLLAKISHMAKPCGWGNINLLQTVSYGLVGGKVPSEEMKTRIHRIRVQEEYKFFPSPCNSVLTLHPVIERTPFCLAPDLSLTPANIF